MFNKQRAFTSTSTSATTITNAIAEFIILDMKPLDTVEGEGFKSLLRVLEPRYSVVSRNHILERYIVPMYHHTVDRVKQELSKAVRHVFTTDGWTSLAAESFLTTTCHFIEPQTYKLKSVVLDTKFCPKNHTAENLAAEMKISIQQCNLKDPVSVTDNAANIVKACELADLPHIGCFGHVLNLAVNRCLSVPEVNALLGKCRKLVAVFKQSALKTTALHSAEADLKMKQLQVIQDVETRWNAALSMISRLLEILPAIWAVLYKDKKYMHLLPSDTDRKNMEDLKDLLQPVDEATKRVSAEKNSTVSLILPTVERFVKHDFSPKHEDSPIIVKAKTAIRNDHFKRYLKEDEQKLLLKATVVDPRFKKLQWVDDVTKDELYTSLKNEMMNIEIKNEPCSLTLNQTEIKLEKVETTVDKKDSPSQAEPEKKKFKINQPQTENDFFEVLFVKEEKSELTDTDKVTKEFISYMEEDVTFKQDPIDWWRCNRRKYPRLSQIAMKFLHVPATSVPSERVFSSAGSILCKKRSSLTPDNADMLVFLYHNYCKMRTPKGN